MTTETKHTPGPWKVGKGTNGFCPTWQVHHESTTRSKVVADCGAITLRNYQGSTEHFIGEAENKESEANARRIVACVNHCEGISTEDLQAIDRAADMHRYTDKVLQQRDELLAALIRLRDCPDVQMDCTDPETDAARLQANAAIAKVQGGNHE